LGTPKYKKITSSKSKPKLVVLGDGWDFEPLGSKKRVGEDGDKDREERRLHSVRFGKPYAPSSKGRASADCEGEDEDIPEADVELAGTKPWRCAIHTNIGKRVLEFDSGYCYS
jgi:hypothetical protein